MEFEVAITFPSSSIGQATNAAKRRYTSTNKSSFWNLNLDLMIDEYLARRETKFFLGFGKDWRIARDNETNTNKTAEYFTNSLAGEVTEIDGLVVRFTFP
jgi:hypothetical protein